MKLDDLSGLRKVDSLTNDGGSAFLAAATDAGGNLLLLRGDAVNGLPGQWEAYAVNNGQLTRVASGGVPRMNVRAPFVNVLLFDGEPFVDSAARLLVQLQAGEWTTAAEVEPGLIRLDASESIVPEKGLEPVGQEMLSPVPQNTTDALVNQYARAISLSSDDPAPQVATSSIQTDPPAGTYRASVAVTLFSPDPALDLFYRRESGGDIPSRPGVLTTRRSNITAVPAGVRHRCLPPITSLTTIRTTPTATGTECPILLKRPTAWTRPKAEPTRTATV